MNHQTSSDRRNIVTWLIVAHIVIATLSSLLWSIGSDFLWTHFLALIYCQASLIGIWGGLGSSHWMMRWIGVALGTVLLSLWLHFGIGIGDLIGIGFYFLALTTWTIALVTWGLRTLGARLEPVGFSTATSGKKIQFTIGQLMLLTLVIACVMTLGKLVASYAANEYAGGEFIVSVLITQTACFAVIALASLWTILRLDHPVRHSMIVLTMAGVLGWAVAEIVLEGEPVIWTFALMLESTYLMASLYVLRIAGYRLVARLPEHSE